MNKKQVGWIINGILIAGAVVTSLIFPNPAIIFPVVASCASMGTLQSIFTIVETRGEREERAGKRNCVVSEEQIDRSSRERENLGEKQYVRMATQEDYNSNPSPAKVYESLHSNTNKATFSGTHKRYSTFNTDSTVKQDDEMIL